MSIELFFQQRLPAAYKKMLEQVEIENDIASAVFAFNILDADDAQWLIKVDGENVEVKRGEEGEADCKVSMKEDVLFKLMEKRLNIVLAFTFGKIKIEGSTSKLLLFKDILGYL